VVASGIDLEIEHGSRAAIVGDNGQGKTTFLRTIVDSLEPLAGTVKWGHGCSVGTYAQHVYTSLPPKQTVQDYLEYQAAPGTKTQEILNVAGAMLFRGEHVKKKISVLSGGERARLCMAGLLLSQYNILILDEPGNHLDVDTVEALADALLAYKGTVIFTSHDRHFMGRVASCVIEVRDGRVVDYRGDYDAYLYQVNKEIDDGEREMLAAKKIAPPPTNVKSLKVDDRRNQKDERQIRKEMSNLEKTIQRLDDQRKALNDQLLNCSDCQRGCAIA
jgi:ATP-binding cassette subfamily F protein 3